MKEKGQVGITKSIQENRGYQRNETKYKGTQRNKTEQHITKYEQFETTRNKNKKGTTRNKLEQK